MEIVEDRGLLVRVRDHERITTAIKQSKYLSRIGSDAKGDVHEVLVKWNLENTRRLANMGISKAPSTILRDYNWPGAYKPFAHQRETASFLTANNRAFCFSEQGTGKTGAAIWAADYLMSIGDVKRVLVICPLSIMHSAWMQDIFKIAMHRTAAVAHGTKETRKKVINGDYEFVIINFDGVPTVKDELKGKFDLVIADEANFVKTATTRRWKALNEVLTPDMKLWMMTGTPAAQSPLDAFGLAKLVCPQRVPKYYTAWRDRVMVRITQFKWVPTPNATKLVNAALQPAIRFTKKDCLDLPPVTYQTREIELTPQQKKYYKELKKQMLIEAAGEQISAVHAAAGLNKLLQLSCGAVYSDEGEVVQFDGKNRLDEIVEVVQEAAHKVIVFVPFRHAIDIVADRLRKEGYSTEVISGAVPMTARTKIFKDFQTTDDPRVLVIQPQSAAHGVTLTAADTIVWFGPVASVETWLQANERINRPSQKNKMTIIKIYGSEVEKRVYDALESKEANQKDLVALYEQEING
jgi:SNF2 family DNA or RNA helicase